MIDRVFLALMSEQRMRHPNASADWCWAAAEYRLTAYVALPAIFFGLGVASAVPSVAQLMRSNDLLFLQLGACVVGLSVGVYFRARFSRYRFPSATNVMAAGTADAELLRRFRISTICAGVVGLALLVWMGRVQ